MKFYPQSLVVRVLLCVAAAIFAANLGIYTKNVLVNHGAFIFDTVSCCLLPAAVGIASAIVWKEPAK